MGPSLSLYARLSRLVVQNCLSLADFSRITGLEVTRSAPGTFSQWGRDRVRDRLADVLSGGNEDLRRLLIATSTLDAWVPWTSYSPKQESEGMAVTALAPSLDCLRYCPECWLEGYHSLLHQLPWVIACPFHGVRLLRNCLICGRTTGMDSPRNAVIYPFRCEHCGSQMGGRHLTSANTERELVALRWLAEAAAFREGDGAPSVSACVLAVPSPDPGVVNKLCQFVYADLRGIDFTSNVGICWVDVPDKDREMRATLEAMPTSAQQARDLSGFLSNFTVGVMARSAQTFIDLFHSVRGKQLKWRPRDVGNAKSRATIIATQYARRALADAWIRCISSCEVTLTDQDALGGKSFVRWMLAGPVWMLGRYSAVQAILGSLDSDMADEDGACATLNACRHAVVVREQNQSGACHSLATVSDARVVSALATIVDRH